MSNNLGNQLKEAQQYWDNEAETFDAEPDHGLKDPMVWVAWTELLQGWQPAPPAKILDIGCGTGSLSLVLAKLGQQVTGIDLSPKMIAQARAKADKAGLLINFAVMGAAQPGFPKHSFNGIVCRHVLWMLPDIVDALQNWCDLLQPGARVLLVEGFWHTGGGLHAGELLAAIPSAWQNVTMEDLSARAEFWGKEVGDERYALTAEIP
jgi:2-polyprenyl-3-methyl-5-hydroxy-6-metoxy-1,4-benzoquinol methylase